LLSSSAHDGSQSSSTGAESYVVWSKFCFQVDQDKISDEVKCEQILDCSLCPFCPKAAEKAISSLGCMSRSTASKLKEVTAPSTQHSIKTT